MVIYTYFYGWRGDALIALLDQKSSDEEIHRRAIAMMREEGAVEYAQEKARLIMRRAWKEIEPKLQNCDAKEDIHALCNYLINR